MIDLSADWSYLENVARERLSRNKTIHHVTEYGEGIELMGAAGELAARRYFNLPTELHLDHDHGVDFWLSGRSVDVKATHWTKFIYHRYLQWPRKKPFSSDIILMTAVDMSTRQAELLGYATKLDLLNAPVNHKRRFPCYEIPVPSLRPIWELDTMIKSGECPRSLVYPIQPPSP